MKSKKASRTNSHALNSTTDNAKKDTNEILKLTEVLCCVCKSVLVEPVSLPCNHRFCLSCWLATDALRCLLCRKRVGSWLRESTRRNHLVDEKLWSQIREQFSAEITKKMNGIELNIPEETVTRQLSLPGEIRAEYEAELKRLAAERLLLENKSSKETELLITKIQEEEEAAHKAYDEKLKADEELARQLQEAEEKQAKALQKDVPVPNNKKANGNKKNKSSIEKFLVKKCPDVQQTNNDVATNTKIKEEENNKVITEPPKYGCVMEDFTDSKLSNAKTMPQKQSMINTSIENYIIKSDTRPNETIVTKPTIITKAAQKQMCPDPPSMSYFLSLPHCEDKGVAALKDNAQRQDSANSMEQELCYFKPIQSTVVTLRTKAECKEALRVPAVRGAVGGAGAEPRPPPPPDYWTSLRRLRGEADTPSAFVCLLHLKEASPKCDISDVKLKPEGKTEIGDTKKEVHSFRRKPLTKMSKEDRCQKLRRTRSTSNIKTRESSRKRAASRKSQSEVKISQFDSLKLKMDRVNLVNRKLSSPLEICGAVMLNKYKSGEGDDEWRRREKAREEEQVRQDAELALRVEAEWNRGYALRRVPAKRRPAIPHALILAPTKKIKV